jgi:hypothetical protein
MVKYIKLFENFAESVDDILLGAVEDGSCTKMGSGNCWVYEFDTTKQLHHYMDRLKSFDQSDFTVICTKSLKAVVVISNEVEKFLDDRLGKLQFIKDGSDRIGYGRVPDRKGDIALIKIKYDSDLVEVRNIITLGMNILYDIPHKAVNIIVTTYLNGKLGIKCSNITYFTN